MEWMKGLQKAIDYIEEHLDEEIDYTEIARHIPLIFIFRGYFILSADIP